ncbi:hypothetical protein BGZ91_000870 [Linnemannia elongata]|nr:hypothetical protein BGZ91_000870 [Linnemannia elongata]
MVILTFTNLVFITIHYAEGKYGSNSGTYRIFSYIDKGLTVKNDKFFLWQDWALIVSSSVLFLAYIYAYKVITTRLHKYLRALLMLIPTVLVLLVGIQYICLVLSLDYPMPDGPPTPFDCAYLSGLERIYCGVVEFSPFFAIVMGLFALLEIYTTTRKGPMLPKGYHQSYIPNVGYAEGVNVDYVRPPEMPMTIKHPLWLQNPYGGGDGNQQSSTLNRPFFPFPSYWAFPPEQNIPNYVNSMDPAATPGPRPLQQLPSLPEEVFDNRLPIPTTAQGPGHPYQPPNMPSVGAEVSIVGVRGSFVGQQFDVRAPRAPQELVSVQRRPQEEEEEEEEEEFDDY